MESYIELIGTLQNSGFGLVKGSLVPLDFPYYSASCPKQEGVQDLDGPGFWSLRFSETIRSLGSEHYCIRLLSLVASQSSIHLIPQMRVSDGWGSLLKLGGGIRQLLTGSPRACRFVYVKGTVLNFMPWGSEAFYAVGERAKCLTSRGYIGAPWLCVCRNTDVVLCLVHVA